MQRLQPRSLITQLAVAAALVGLASSASATHSWGGYHWARTANPFTLKLGDNLNATWDPYLNTTSADWSKSAVLGTTIVPGTAKPRNCRPTAGQADICNATYGNTGWLGVAQIWISGGTDITQGAVKLNDTYFNTTTYNTPAWRNLVSCQEAGHILGLDHQDTTFDNANFGSCMDYTNDPSTNQQPNAHDYEELATIYAHLDSATTISSTTPMPTAMLGRDFDRQSSWGQMVKRSRDGAREIYERSFGNGFKLVTHVFWALQEGGPAHRQQRANEE